MPKLSVTLSILFSSLFIVSCSKEESKDEKGLSGTYKFISMESHTVNTEEASDAQHTEKSVTYSDYITKDNTGSIQFSGSTLTSSNLAYSIDTTVKAYFYYNNSLTDSAEVPFQMTMPPSSGVTTYKMISSDSIYVNSGFIAMGGNTQQTVPSGMKIKVDGNILYMYANVSQTTSVVSQGVTDNKIVKASVKMTFQKN